MGLLYGNVGMESYGKGLSIHGQPFLLYVGLFRLVWFRRPLPPAWPGFDQANAVGPQRTVPPDGETLFLIPLPEPAER